jgi:hypothetical protein
MQQPGVLIIDDSELERYMLNHQLDKVAVSAVVQKMMVHLGLNF